MDEMRLALLAIAAGLVSACQANQTPPDAALIAAQRQSLERPTGRFQIAGKREYTNGTEIYVLDTQSGQVCYYFVVSNTSDDKKLAQTDMMACAGEALSKG